METTETPQVGPDYDDDDDEMQMAQDDIKEIRAMLLAERDSIYKRLEEKQNREKQEVGDEIDNSVMSQEQDLEALMEGRDHAKLKQIEDALHRMDIGEYGWCEDTGEWIGKKRLMALPFTRLSLEAQREKERDTGRVPFTAERNNYIFGSSRDSDD